MRRIALVVLLVVALAASLAAAPAGGLAQKTKAEKPVTGPKAMELALRKLPADGDFVGVFDVAAMRAIPALAEMADGLFPIEEDGPEGEIIAALLKSMDIMAVGGSDQSVAVLLGRFRELQSPLFQTAFKSGAERLRSFRGITIYEFDSDTFAVQAFVDVTTWVLGNSVADVKRIIDLVLDRSRSAFDTPQIKEVLKKTGKPGYIFAAGAPEALQDEDEPELEGLVYGGVNLTKRSNTTTAVTTYWRFDQVVNAGKGAAQLKDIAVLSKIAGLRDITKPTVKQQKDVVLVDFTVPNSAVRQRFAEG